MKAPSYQDAFEVLCLQLAANGRAPVLLGDDIDRVRNAIRPFVLGKKFPSVYFEFPLLGDPFLDITVLYSGIEPGTRVDSPAAEGTEALLDWYAGVCDAYESINVGFEVDVSNPELPAAGIHFQPRTHTELVDPFCEAVGEPERAALYLDLAARMPQGWPLSFFGMFRGRPGSPLRVCGYLGSLETLACANDPGHVASVFDAVGFKAYDAGMLAQVSQIMSVVPHGADFQFDIYPDGRIGDVFAIDVSFKIEQPEAVSASFANGCAAQAMRLFDEWGIADSRYELAVDATFARAIPVELDDGSIGRYAFTLMPQWAKVRWRNGVLQPAKLYNLGGAGVLDE